MVGELGEVRIIDWGLATSLQEDGLAGRVAGTPAYMAPEQARGEASESDPSVDVFALGAILCELLTGAPPYRGDTEDETLLMAARGWTESALTRLDGVDCDPDLKALVRRCLNLHPAHRPPNAGAVWRLLRDHFDAAARRAHELELEAARRQEATAHRRRLKRRTVAAAVVILVSGAVILSLVLSARSGSAAWSTRSNRRATAPAGWCRKPGAPRAPIPPVGNAPSPPPPKPRDAARCSTVMEPSRKRPEDS